MYIASASLLLAFLTACSAPDRVQTVERVELRLSGWEALDVEVNRQGEGRWRLSEPIPNGRTGAFRITAQQFARLVERLAVYRRQAAPMTDESMLEMMRRTCPAGVHFITDQGAVWVHWTGSNVNDHYSADLGCDPERNARRNEDLMSILQTLPVPLDP